MVPPVTTGGLPVPETMEDDVQEFQQDKDQRSNEEVRGQHSDRNLKGALVGEVLAEHGIEVHTGVVSSVGGASIIEQEVNRLIDSCRSEGEHRGDELEGAIAEVGLHRAFDPEV